MKYVKSTSLWGLMYLLLCLPLAACGLSGDAIDGRVLEEGTNKPIPGAIVTVSWMGSVFAFVDTQTVCVHVDTAITDMEGRYHVNAWRSPSNIGWVRHVAPIISAYKPAYEGTPQNNYLPQFVDNDIDRMRFANFKKGLIYLKPFNGPVGGRLKHMGDGFGNLFCGSEESYRKALEPLSRAMYEEARSLATQDEEDQKIVDQYLTGWETMKYGSEVADQNREQRRLNFLRERQQ